MKRFVAWTMGLAVATMAVSAHAEEVTPFPLTTCPVSGAALENGGVAKVFEGQEVRFCCAGCPNAFAEDVEAGLAKVTAAIIEDQKALYPVEDCVVMDHDIDLATATWFVIDNRAVAVCCGSCERRVKADPADYIAMLDEAATAQQGADYPLDTCIVAGADLGDSPVEFVVAGRLVRTCCGGCASKVKAEPAVFLSKLADASQG